MHVCMYVIITVSIYVYQSMYLYPSIYLSVYLNRYLYLYTCMYMHVLHHVDPWPQYWTLAGHLLYQGVARQEQGPAQRRFGGPDAGLHLFPRIHLLSDPFYMHYAYE